MLKKNKGSGLVILALVGAVVVGVTSLSLAKANSVAVSSLKGNTIALQAQQYADSKLNLVALKGYSNLSAESRQSITGTSFEESVSVGAEANEGNGVKSKLVTVSVFRTGDSVSRASLSKKVYSISKSDVSFGSPIVLPTAGTFIAPASGFICAAGSRKGSSLNIKVNATTLGFVVGRDYGSGNISACVPVSKGDSINISGYCAWAYLVPFSS